MRKTVIYFILCAAVLVHFTACEDMLDVDSDRYVEVDDNDLSSPNDSVHSILGLFSQMQHIGERYILLGEMRADLLDVSPFTPADIRQINDFTVEPTNPYADPVDYYEIINNCNYIISRTSSEDHPLEKENVAARAIRAWTYMQIAFNWGKVYYFTDPILSPEDENKNYPLYDFTTQKDQFISLLIEDLEPYVDVPDLNYGMIYDFHTSNMLFSKAVLLGDLYLWRGQSQADFEQSATYYAKYFVEESLGLISPSISWSYQNFLNQDFEKYPPYNGWSAYTVANSGASELTTVIQMAKNVSDGLISSLPENYLYFQPADNIYTLWDEQSYVYRHQPTGTTGTNYYTTGDLRKRGNIYASMRVTGNNLLEPVTMAILYKIYNAEHILLYRKGLILLRYAEALNRSERPNAAFAVLKYGFNTNTFTEKKIPEHEMAPFITIFNNPDNLTSFWGIHSRGCGDSYYDIFYTIEKEGEELATKADTIRRVEDLICDELALETSFEGNRFQDLMRFSLRRGNPDFLAKKVAEKHRSENIYQLLLDMKNWFLPEPER